MQSNPLHNESYIILLSSPSNKLQLNWSTYFRKTSNLYLTTSTGGQISLSFTFSCCELHPAKQKDLKLKQLRLKYPTKNCLYMITKLLINFNIVNIVFMNKKKAYFKNSADNMLKVLVIFQKAVVPNLAVWQTMLPQLHVPGPVCSTLDPGMYSQQAHTHVCVHIYTIYVYTHIWLHKLTCRNTGTNTDGTWPKPVPLTASFIQWEMYMNMCIYAIRLSPISGLRRSFAQLLVLHLLAFQLSHLPRHTVGPTCMHYGSFHSWGPQPRSCFLPRAHTKTLRVPHITGLRLHLHWANKQSGGFLIQPHEPQSPQLLACTS